MGCCPCLKTKPDKVAQKDNNNLVSQHCDELQGLVDTSNSCELSSPKKSMQPSICKQYIKDDATHITIDQESSIPNLSTQQMIQQSDIEQPSSDYKSKPRNINTTDTSVDEGENLVKGIIPKKGITIVSQPQKTIYMKFSCHHCNQLDTNLVWIAKCKHRYHSECLNAILLNTPVWEYSIRCTGKDITSQVLKNTPKGYMHRILQNNQLDKLAQSEKLIRCSQRYCTFMWKGDQDDNSINCPYEHY